jgi:hypothetical protein
MPAVLKKQIRGGPQQGLLAAWAGAVRAVAHSRYGVEEEDSA